MDKLEQYLDRVCRSLGGPRAMRQHVRQELREHLLDAVAQHRSAGFTEEESVRQALEEFGTPDEVRSELEAAHGQRLLPVVIDKAMHWKEMTMRAKWLWTSWAYLCLGIVIALEVLFLTFAVVLIVPKYQVLMQTGIIDRGLIDEEGASWMPSFLERLSHIGGGYATWWLLLAIVALGLFEWRVRSENKTYMRFTVLGTVAVGLMLLVWCTAGALVVSFTLAAPATGAIARSFANEQIARLDVSLVAIEQARGMNDWEGVRQQADRAIEALGNLTKSPMVIPAMTKRYESPTIDEVRAQVQAATEAARQVQHVATAKDVTTTQVEKALGSFRASIGSLHETMKRAGS
jgi:hypothetical protein